MKFFGDAQLQQNLLSEAVLPVDEAFPTSPKVGQLVFTQGILYICIQIVDSLPFWAPLTKVITSYTHNQGSAATTWTVNHNLNTAAVSVTVYDSSARVIIPDDVEVITPNQVEISFTSAFSGSAVVLTGAPDGVQLPTYAFEFMQSSPSDTWVINHGLGRYPIVRVFIGNYEVQPLSIQFNSVNQITITFSTPQVGQVKLI